MSASRKGQSYNMTVNVIFCLTPGLTEAVAKALQVDAYILQMKEQNKKWRRIEPQVPNCALGAQDTTAILKGMEGHVKCQGIDDDT